MQGRKSHVRGDINIAEMLREGGDGGLFEATRLLGYTAVVKRPT
jgi:hypothetical protein